MSPIITSLLDTDLYKLTMQQAIFSQYPNVIATYKFINRGNSMFGTRFLDSFQTQLKNFKDLQLTDEEFLFLKKICPYFKPTYLDFLRGYRFDPSEVSASTSEGQLNVTIHGPWYRTVLWEVPLMALISELYYGGTGDRPDSYPADVNIDQAKAAMVSKASLLKSNNVSFADFGTRRRFSKYIQDMLVNVMDQHSGSGFKGTSNVMLAKKYGVSPIGTQAHEWIMAHAAMFGFRKANQESMEAWVREYDGDLGIALTDTFTSPVFFRDFTTKYAKLFDGVRQDSGDPFTFASMAIDHYKANRIDPRSKTIVFSDGLNVDKAVEISRFCDNKINCSFGIGTHFTNDVGCVPLNMVIKMTQCNEVPVIKLSDANGKNTGDEKEIKYCKYVFGIKD